MYEQHHRELDALAFQHGVPAAIGRFAPVTRHRVDRRRRRAPRSGRPLWAGITFVVLGLLALTLGLTGPTARPAAAADLEPYQVVTGVTRVAVGGGHSCAVTTEHHIRCWGQNDLGQAGVGEASSLPVAYAEVRNRAGSGPLTGAVSVVNGYRHSCALLTSGEVRCWGGNGFGQLGDGSADNRYLPVPVLASTGSGHLRGVTRIAAAGDVTCAVLDTAQARCWGNNDDGQLGNGAVGSARSRPTPVRAVAGPGPLTGVTQIAVGTFDVCARLSSGEARCWGQNVSGQVGDGSTDLRGRPVVVRNASGAGPLVGVRSITVGTDHACSVQRDGTARCWGANASGQLGNGTFDPHRLPVVVVADGSRSRPLTGIAAVDAGEGFTCARLTNSQARCWGEDRLGQLGNNLPTTDSAVPGPVRNTRDDANIVGVAQLDANVGHTCVRLTNGQARCWGYGETGGLGDGNVVNRALPRVVVAPVN
jgi:alpha-tubulin suppressor-like RCC1 family protein